MFPKIFLRPKILYIAIAFVSLFLIGEGVFLLSQPQKVDYGSTFDGERAYQDAAYQMSLGPRTPDSEAHARAIEWLTETLRAAGWQVEVQHAELLGHPIQNVIAKRGEGQPWFILGAHYDSRLYADHDPDPANHQLPVPGANDGASGVAVLTELARVLPEDFDGQIWLAFFDAEDNGSIEDWDWILGSRVLADSLTSAPNAVVVVDMIGDADLNIYKESNSDPTISAELWTQAAELGYGSVFIDSIKYSMLDDHTPFLADDIPAVDLIDFDYPYWHTRADTLDKLSAQSLQAVGDTLLAWLLSK